MTDETTTGAPSAPAENEGRRANATTVWVLITLGAIVMVLSTLNIWVERQLLDTDSWVETSTALLDDDEVRRELSVRLVDRLYDNVSVGTAIDENLPEQLQGLGGPLAGLLRSPLVNTVDELLQSPPVQTAWEEANRIVHTTVVAILEDDVGEAISTSGGAVVIDLRSVLVQVGEQIGLPEAALEAIPEDAGQFTIVESDTLEAAQGAVRAIKLLSVLLFLVVVILYGAAFYLASNWRREAARSVGFAMALGGFIVLVAVALGVRFIAGLPDTEGGRAVADSVGAIGTALLRQSAWSEILIGLLIALIASLVGPTRYARQVRYYSAKGFRRSAVAMWIGFALLILAALAWAPFTAAENWLSVLFVLILVVVGVEAIRRTSLAEEATLDEDAREALAEEPTAVAAE
jgi:hypothetical protein